VRYDWLVDRQPDKLRFTKLADVSCRIQVGIEFKATLFAFELQSFPVVSIDVSAFAASLRSVLRVDLHHSFTQIL
jgi:hypothetical protein